MPCVEELSVAVILQVKEDLQEGIKAGCRKDDKVYRSALNAVLKGYLDVWFTIAGINPERGKQALAEYIGGVLEHARYRKNLPKHANRKGK